MHTWIGDWVTAKSDNGDHKHWYSDIKLLGDYIMYACTICGVAIFKQRI